MAYRPPVSSTPAVSGNSALASAKVWVGDAGGLAQERTLSGDVTNTNTGVTAIGARKVTNAMLAAQASATVNIGQGAGVDVAATALSGDVTMAATGATTIANLAVTDAKVAAANKDGVAGTASMRTLGTGAQQAAAGNHTHTSKTLIGGRSDNSTAVTATTYMVGFFVDRKTADADTNENNSRTALPYAGTLKNLRIWYVADQAFTITVRVNGADTGITITTNSTGSITEGTDLANTAAVSAGDYVTISYVQTSGVNKTLNMRYTLELDATI